jgi:hypothetical protein
MWSPIGFKCGSRLTNKFEEEAPLLVKVPDIPRDFVSPGRLVHQDRDDDVYRATTIKRRASMVEKPMFAQSTPTVYAEMWASSSM